MNKSFHVYFIVMIALVCGLIFLAWTRMEKPEPVNQSELRALQDSLKKSAVEKQQLQDSLINTVENNSRERAKADSIHLISMQAILEFKGMKKKNEKEMARFRELPLDSQAEYWKNSVLQ